VSATDAVQGSHAHGLHFGSRPSAAEEDASEQWAQRHEHVQVPPQADQEPSRGGHSGVPTGALVMRGALDGIVSAEEAQALASELSGSGEVVTLQDLSHNLMLERPDLFVNLFATL